MRACAAVCGRVSGIRRCLRRRCWPELAGKTLGILGYGRIGQALARRARAFDMVLWAIRQHPAGSDRDGLAFLGGPDALDEILHRADYLAITLSLTEATRGLAR